MATCVECGRGHGGIGYTCSIGCWQRYNIRNPIARQGQDSTKTDDGSALSAFKLTVKYGLFTLLMAFAFPPIAVLLTPILLFLILLWLKRLFSAKGLLIACAIFGLFALLVLAVARFGSAQKAPAVSRGSEPSLPAASASLKVAGSNISPESRGSSETMAGLPEAPKGRTKTENVRGQSRQGGGDIDLELTSEAGRERNFIYWWSLFESELKCQDKAVMPRRLLDIRSRAVAESSERIQAAVKAKAIRVGVDDLRLLVAEEKANIGRLFGQLLKKSNGDLVETTLVEMLSRSALSKFDFLLSSVDNFRAKKNCRDIRPVIVDAAIAFDAHAKSERDAMKRYSETERAKNEARAQWAAFFLAISYKCELKLDDRSKEERVRSQMSTRYLREVAQEMVYDIDRLPMKGPEDLRRSVRDQKGRLKRRIAPLRRVCRDTPLNLKMFDRVELYVLERLAALEATVSRFLNASGDFSSFQSSQLIFVIMGFFDTAVRMEKLAEK